ncbi:MAG: excinuclease ABC subunit UvrC [Chitinispirillaceae bacterium]|nr:excinuclease ABC subunit UvrC [Chitinispirillaceae bacterium]
MASARKKIHFSPMDLQRQQFPASPRPLPDLISRFPESPGVYLMKNSAGVPIYIGKALNLRCRVRSYFLEAHDGRPNIPFMLRNVVTIDWIATNNETEALILEANLIRKHQPRYNVDLRDDKHFPYLKVTVQEPFPRLLVVRRIERDGAKYFGPYTDATAMRRLVAFARHIFRLRDCKRILPAARPVRPCINLSMHRCSGACNGTISETAYREQVEHLLRFLSGRRIDLICKLSYRMEKASSELRFEEAASLRDQIKLIKDASRLQQVDLKLDDTDCDVFGLADGERGVCLAVLQFREGLLVNSHHFLFAKTTWTQANPNHDNLFLQFYLVRGDEPPPLILLPENVGFSHCILQQWVNQQFNRNIQIIVPQKGTRKLLIDMAKKNALLYLNQNVTIDHAQELADLQQALKLSVYPETIEAFDISNIGASFSVAGMVQFKGGRPNKSAYRKYRIRSVEDQNDFAMMLEVVTRRLKRLYEENKQFPDLLLIDGGPGQLHAAKKAFQLFENQPFIVSLAKQEEILYAAHLAKPIKLPPTHPARKLVERIRDEVHRYAISYHKKIRGKQFSSSQLEQIEGIGKRRAELLLRKFGSMKRIKEAAVAEIIQVPGITENMAKRIKGGQPDT